ncbi:MAG: phosphate ABC transporter permease subunit PstC [Candidatus Kapaibacteriota bacterium]
MPEFVRKKRPKKQVIIELLAEWGIRITASFSIIVIFLIFIFVFREAGGLIFGTAKELKPKVEKKVSEADIVKPEVYNPETGEIEKIKEKETKKKKDSKKISIWENIAGSVWQPVGKEPKYGIFPLLVGTLKVTFIALLLATPLAIFAAIYTAFFAKRSLREWIKPIVEILAGFPSVVLGFFCLVTIVRGVNLITTFLQPALDGLAQGIGFILPFAKQFFQEALTISEFHYSAFVGGIGLGLAVIPIIFTITEDALSAVPKSYREASLALGATEWETAFNVMLPAALPGVVAAVLLGIGRAFGETMIALMATGNAALISWNMFHPIRTLAATIGSETGEVQWGSLHYNILFFLGILLFVVSFTINAITELFVKKYLAKKFQGA